MPFNVSLENQILQIKLSGLITAQDIVNVTLEVKKFESDGKPVPHRVTDVTGITELTVRYPDVEAIAALRKGLKFSNPYKSAIVAKEKLHIGYARMFQQLNTNPQINVQIFSDVESANKWIVAGN